MPKQLSRLMLIVIAVASTSVAYARGTVTTANPALGLVPGMGNSNSYGTRGMATYNPRQFMLRATLRF